MNQIYLLQPDVDTFVGLCFFGHLAKASLEVPQGVPGDARLKGSVRLGEAEYPLEAWVGSFDEAGSETEEAVWLKVQDRTLNVSALGLNAVAELAPEGFTTELRDAAEQLLAMVSAAYEAITDSDEQGTLSGTIKHLTDAAATVRSRAETDEEATSAFAALVWNCSNSLIGRVEIVPSVNSHLRYDVNAATLNPETMKPIFAGIGWMAGPKGPEHSVRLGNTETAAHSGSFAESILEGMDPESRHHYLHVFTHLHQIADAADTYVQAMQHIAYADEGTLGDPLDFEERHETAHELHVETAADLSTYTRMFSEEPTAISGRP